MRKKSLLLLLLMALFMPWAAQAQDRPVVTIGEGTSTQNYPLPGFYGYQYDVFLYTPSAAPALGVDSEISSLAFDVVSNNTNTGAEMYIWVKDVDADYALATATTFNEYITDATQVYANDDFSSTEGWNTFSFASTFSHEGGKALLVAVRGVGCSTSGGCSRGCHYTSATNTWWNKHVDSSDPGQEVSGTVGNSRANIQLDLTYTGSVCFPPTGLTYTNVTENAATLSWTENGESTAWTLEYGTANDFVGATTVNVSGTPTTSLSGLSALTTYYVRVKADCGSDWLTGSFTTTAVAEAVENAWSDDFEGTSCGWELINGTLTNAWAWGTATNNGGTHALYISNDGGSTNAYTNNSAAMVYATKLLNFADGKYEFTYDWIANGESSYDYLRVALVPASVTLTAGTSAPSSFGPTGLPTGWIALDGGSKLNLATAWQSMNATVNVTAGNYYLVMAWRDDTSTGTNPPAAVDNVSITKVTCDQDVTNLAVSEITTSSATLSWDGGEATQWQVAYSTASNFEGATEEVVSTASYNMSGLMTSTMYYVKVRAYCGGEDFGSWSDVLSFATACDVIDALGYTESFDSYTAGNNVLPNCWSYINTTTNSTYAVYPRVYANGYSTYANSAPNCLYFYSYGSSDPQPQYAILPEMTGLAGLQVTLMAKGYNASSTLKIGTMSDPTDASTFTMIDEQTLTTSYPAEPFEFIIPANCSDSYLAIMMDAAPSGYNTRGVYVDDITIAEVPTCLKPTELAVTGVSTTTATLGWTNGADDQTAWQIMLNGNETNLIMANSNPFTIEDLTAATSYTAKVRAYCGADDQSDWSTEVSFTTACEAITDLPWNENFDAYTGSTSSSAPTGYPNDEMPNCWQFLNRSDNSTTYPQVFISSNSGYPVSGNCLFFKSSSSTPLYAVLPEFEEDIAGLQLTFTYRNEGTTASNGTLIVGYMTNPADATTFTAVQTCEITTTLTEMEVPFTSAPAGSYMAFMYQGGSSNNYYLSIDNVSVDYIPTCAKPTDLTFVSATTTTATLSWTSGANETAWQIMLNDDEENLIMAENNQWVIEGLTASTAYTAKVRAYCSADDQSDWSNEVSFATDCDVVVVDATHPLFENFEGITSGIPVCWDNSEGTTTDESYKWNYFATGHNGHCVRFNSYNNSEDNTNFLKTPVMDLPNEGDNLQLSFWYKNPAGGDFSVFISTDGGDTYTTALASDLTDQSDWTKEVISLSEYAGNENVAIVFAGTSNWGYGDAYIYLDEVFVGMPYTLTIEGVGEENWNNENNSGYYLIASPVTVDLTSHDMTTGEFDLYYFDQVGDEDGNEWMNYKNESFNLEPGKGYLYAHKIGGEFTLTGTAYTGDGTIELVYDENATDFQGWNLVGNPWTVKAYTNKDFYTMNNDGSGVDVTVQTAGTEIASMTGIFVVAEGEDETVTFATENPGKTVARLNLNITRNSSLIDRAIVRFSEGSQLPKFQLNPNHTKIYMSVDGKDYAIVNATEMGEMPVSFKAESDGSYTLSINAEEVSFAYLHLIDNMTGKEVNLLETPSYSFEANTTDYANRFKLVFATGNNGDDDTFAFFSNGSFVINNEGNATVQVIDVNGRIISSESINGCANVNVKAASGVYMIRLVNGDNVKVQKVVVK